jgi:LytS/YehU family sensor histidine kinase
LQKQIDPHFLFNSLSTLRSMIRRGTPQAEEFVLSLSEIYRQMLQSNYQLVTLEEEMNTVRSYLFLIKQRYDTGLVLKEQIATVQLSRKLPFLAVQTLVENAVKHNSISEKSPLSITITTTVDGRLSVENDRNPKYSSDPDSGVGLSNLQKRYELLGGGQRFEIKQDERTYCVILPLFEQ